MHSESHATSTAWIENETDFHAFIDLIDGAETLALDTEFMRRNTFYPRLALLQIAHAEHSALVDPTVFDAKLGLRESCESPQRTCIMHSASEDLEALAPLLDTGIGTLFDTQIAAAFAGMGAGMSYQKLVQAMTGVELAKGETQSDWLRRPLSASQREYAVQDVLYLETLHEQLHDRLQARDMLAWHAQDCARLLRRAAAEPDPQPQRGLRGASDWPRERQALLRRILLWRESAARQYNVPRPWLLKDAQALQLVDQPPPDKQALQQATRGQRALRSVQREALFEALERPLSDQEIEATEAVLATPRGAQKRALQAMKQATDALAEELDLPGGLLCPRRALEEYVCTQTWPDALEGWRRDLLEPRLQNQLAG